MKRILVVILFLFSILDQALAQQEALNIAVFPYASPSNMILHQKGLKHFLQKELGSPVSIITAKNPQEYLRNVKDGSYDIIFSAPHVGRHSEVKFAYQRIAMTKGKIQGYYIVNKSSEIRTLADAKNKTMSLASKFTILHQIGIQDLKALGIEEGKNIKLEVTKNNVNAIFSLLNGSSDLALTGINIWGTLNPKYKDKLRLLQKTTKAPGFMIMGNSDMRENLRLKLQSAFLNFQKTEEGQKYIFKGFKLIDDESMKSLDDYTPVLN